MTNAQKLAADLDALADLIYRADDVCPEICRMDFSDKDELINCKHPEDKGCSKCIKEWLAQEAVDGEDE